MAAFLLLTRQSSFEILPGTPGRALLRFYRARPAEAEGILPG